MPLRPRSSKRNPNVCSMSAIAFDTAGWEIASCAAAFAMLRCCTTTSRICRSRNLSRLPMRSTHCMAEPYRNGYETLKYQNWTDMSAPAHVHAASEWVEVLHACFELDFAFCYP